MIFQNIPYFTFLQEFELEGIALDLHNDFVIKRAYLQDKDFVIRLKHHLDSTKDVVMIFYGASIMQEKSTLQNLANNSICDIFRQQWIENLHYSEPPNQMLLEISFNEGCESVILTCQYYEVRFENDSTR